LTHGQEWLGDRLRARLAASGIAQSCFGSATLRDTIPLAEEVSKQGAAVVVVRDFDLRTYLESCLTFVRNLDGAIQDKWFRTFTRTLFLVGNPEKLCHRFHFDQVASDGSLGWISPTFPDQTLPIRRLLNSLQFDLSAVGPIEVDFTVPGKEAEGRAWLLYLAIAGLSGPQSLVHLNHILVEGMITGLFRPGDRICIRSVPTLSGLSADFVSVRVHVDLHDPTRLRGYAGIAPFSGGLRNSH
jgi:hypothetical protein